VRAAEGTALVVSFAALHREEEPMGIGDCLRDCNVDGKDYHAGRVELDEEELERLCASYPDLFQAAPPASTAATFPAPETSHETTGTQGETHQTGT
jgi:hypothetical protein